MKGKEQLTKIEAINRMCKIQGLAHAYLGYDTASDCFCCDADIPAPYRNDGRVIDFIEAAVKEAIRKAKDG